MLISIRTIYYNYVCQFFPGQLAFCKKAVVGLAARRIF